MSARTYVPTSAHLSMMLDRAEGARVSIGWLKEQLGQRSFGLTIFVMAVIAFIPGAPTVVGVLVAWPAVQMVLGDEVAVLPRLIARRKSAWTGWRGSFASSRRDSDGSSG